MRENIFVKEESESKAINRGRHMSENKRKSNYRCCSTGGSSSDDGPKKVSGPERHMNPREREIPDAATLRDQWRYAIRQYSKWYSHAWGTAILAGTAFFALGWIIKGENPISSSSQTDKHNNTRP